MIVVAVLIVFPLQLPHPQIFLVFCLVFLLMCQELVALLVLVHPHSFSQIFFLLIADLLAFVLMELNLLVENLMLLVVLVQVKDFLPLPLVMVNLQHLLLGLAPQEIVVFLIVLFYFVIHR